MDWLNRWAIATGVGILAAMLLLAGYVIFVGDAASERRVVAMDRLYPDFISLDVHVELTSFDNDELRAFDQPPFLGGHTMHYDCGNLSVSDACTVSTDIPNALSLRSGYTPVIRDDMTLTVGEYGSDDWAETLRLADTITVNIGDGPQTVTNEGGVFTVTYVDSTGTASTNTPVQHGLASIPPLALWVTAAALATIVAILTAATIRPRRETPVTDAVGVEIFDELTPAH